MQHKHLQFGTGFKVVSGDDHSQVAQMTFGPGETEGGPDNRHRGADQWLFVVSGTGEAVVAGKKVALRAGTLLLIERGETHEIRNTGRGRCGRSTSTSRRRTRRRGTNGPRGGPRR